MTLLDSIGNTPLIKLGWVFIKLEYLNPSGSVKDRIARYIIDKAEKTKQLKKGYTIIEASSGNTGIAFSMVGALKGYKVKIVMPKGLSEERTKIIKALGADIVSVKKLCFTCAIKKADSLATKKVYRPNQFSNQWNIEEHEKGMGKEILKQVDKIDCFVAGVGSGGTLIGVGKAIRKKFPKAAIVAMEPDECSMLKDSGIGKMPVTHRLVCKKHEIEGIADGLIAEIIQRNRDLIDNVVTIKSKDAINMTRKLATLGYFVGTSSGANYLAAQKLKNKYKNIVTLFPDRGERYLSLNFFRK